jgi:hypothetical protein
MLRLSQMDILSILEKVPGHRLVKMLIPFKVLKVLKMLAVGNLGILNPLEFPSDRLGDDPHQRASHDLQVTDIEGYPMGSHA